MPDFSIWAGQLFIGLSSASILLMMGLGLAIVFGLMGVINMAHGELMTAGAYTAFLVQTLFTSQLSDVWQPYAILAALPVAFLVAAVLGWLMEISVIRFLYGRPLETLLATWGVSLIMQQGFRSLFGSNNVSVSTPDWLTGGVTLTPDLQLPTVRLFILGLVLVTLLGLFLVLYRSRTGLMIRAAIQNRGMSAACGVPTRRIDAITFALGSGLAGLAGCALSLIGSVGPSSGQNYIVDAFMVVVVGGVGNLAGAIVGAFGIGELQAGLEYLSSATMGKVLIFGLIIIFLQLRPAGLFPSRSRALD
ncbi:urea ABC transporter permease subunit UrtB [Thermithiobacillus plumbiphilus]|uniref:Urea ABC transporter permease subunit UrtB n=1 Tax=Thermithiobacillus plumbiphilus TaxID=1729899 RepID=A0ABU9DBB3_9PROT